MPAAHGTLPAAGDIEGSRPAGIRPVVGQDSLPGILPIGTCVLSAAMMPAGHSEADKHNAQTVLMVVSAVRFVCAASERHVRQARAA